MAETHRAQDAIKRVVDKHFRAEHLRRNPTFEGYDPIHAQRLADEIVVAMIDAVWEGVDDDLSHSRGSSSSARVSDSGDASDG